MRTMLNAINLFVLDKIFQEKCNGIKLTASTQMFYIRCLSKHFEKLELKYENSYHFEMFDNEFPNYEKWKPKLLELQTAGLVSIKGRSIVFLNTWGNYIEKGVYLTNQSDAEYSSLPKAFQKELAESTSFFELCCMKNKMTKKEYESLLDLFIREQTELGKSYFDINAIKFHLNNWIPSNLEKLRLKKTQSSGKILGD